jgi:hypothetical protein
VKGQMLRACVPAKWWPENYAEPFVYSRSMGVVRAGPFRGMRYVKKAIGSHLAPKLLGTHERELNPCIEEAVALSFQTIVNIGAAEGYYAVGLALRMPHAKIVAYEMSPVGRALVEELMELNGIRNTVTVKGKCTFKDLSGVLAESGPTLVLCDTEGYEAFLLDPLRIPQLRKCYVLVEVHDFVIRGLSDEIRDRFADTHSIQHIWQQPRSRAEFPFTSMYTKLVPTLAEYALAEGRPEIMSWFWMRPAEAA